MAVTYTKEQRQAARQEGLALITLAVPGLEFQGPVPKEESDLLLYYITQFFKRRREWLSGEPKGKVTT